VGTSTEVCVTTFLSSEILWQILTDTVKAANHVDAAIAYLGQGGAKLLPLRRGHRLVVDMSPPTVRSGGTDPREVEKLIRRGVQAFTRRNLHAKLVVADKLVIAGSANISKRSQGLLDEAAILTGDVSVLRRAREFIDRLCTEPIRPEYLEECKRLYRPPRLSGLRTNGKQRQERARPAKLWIVNLSEISIPESELKRYERGEVEAEELVKDKARSDIDSFSWSYKPKMANELKLGDWVIQILERKDKSIIVSPPGQLLSTDHYVRDRDTGKERWVFHLEVSRRGEAMTWEEFRRAAKSVLSGEEMPTPRTKPIRNIQVADGLLGLWTPSGRVARRKP
jgi:hypothetical protein